MKISIDFFATRNIRRFLFISFIIVSLLVGLLSYLSWDAAIYWVVESQQSLHEALGAHVHNVKANPYEHGVALIILSFLYGVFHAIGPGHGKAVIMTYVGSHRETIRNGILISAAAAMLQSVVAIFLVVTLVNLLHLKLADVRAYGDDITVVSYYLVMLLGGILVVTALGRLGLIRFFLSNIQRIVKPAGVSKPRHTHTNHNSSCCGCSHTYVPEQRESAWKALTVIGSMGLRPCSGAIVVLIYSHLVGVMGFGIVATLVMGLGTGLSVSMLAVLTIHARSWIESLVSTGADRKESQSPLFPSVVRLFGGLIIVFLGWSLLSATISSGLSHPLR